MVERDAAMQAVLGAATAIAGLILVFQGYLLSAYLRFEPGDHASTIKPYRYGIVATLIPLSTSILVVLGALGWFLGLDLFWATVAGFILSVLLLFVASVLVTVLVLS